MAAVKLHACHSFFEQRDLHWFSDISDIYLYGLSRTFFFLKMNYIFNNI